MRIALKILTMILIEGYSNCADGSLHPNIGGNGPARFDQCMSDVENLISTYTLGNAFDPSQWRFPTQQNQSPKKVGGLKRDNNKSRKLLQCSIKIVEISIADNTRKS